MIFTARVYTLHDHHHRRHQCIATEAPPEMNKKGLCFLEQETSRVRVTIVLIIRLEYLRLTKTFVSCTYRSVRLCGWLLPQAQVEPQRPNNLAPLPHGSHYMLCLTGSCMRQLLQLFQRSSAALISPRKHVAFPQAASILVESRPDTFEMLIMSPGRGDVDLSSYRSKRGKASQAIINPLGRRSSGYGTLSSPWHLRLAATRQRVCGHALPRVEVHYGHVPH
jgi:hypothetical protein